MNTPSPLELLHPSGHAERLLVIGANSNQILMPVTNSVPAGAFDLVVVAPTAREWASSSWRSTALQGLHTALASDGVGYVLAPRGQRAQVRRMLVHDTDLVVGRAWLHLVSRQGTYQALVSERALGYSVANIVPGPEWKRRLALTATAVRPGMAVVVALWPGVGYVVRHRGAPAVLEWLRRLDTRRRTADSDLRCVVTTQAHGRRQSNVVQLLDESNAGSGVVAKVALAPRAGILRSPREGANLVGIATGAAIAGVRTPALLAQAWLAKRHVLVQTRLEGQSVAMLLQARRIRPSELMWRVTQWLAAWNTSTRTHAQLTDATLHAMVMKPAERITPTFQEGPAYYNWLRQRCGALESRGPLVAAHLDLTTWNMVLWHDSLGIFDWEEAQPRCLPLLDFFYAMTDIVATAASARHRLNRARALQQCLAPSGVHSGEVRALLRFMRHNVGIPDELVDICLHACFLQHAADEQDRVLPSNPTPFRAAVEWLAVNRHDLRHWLLE